MLSIASSMQKRKKSKASVINYHLFFDSSQILKVLQISADLWKAVTYVYLVSEWKTMKAQWELFSTAFFFHFGNLLLLLLLLFQDGVSVFVSSCGGGAQFKVTQVSCHVVLNGVEGQRGMSTG